MESKFTYLDKLNNLVAKDIMDIQMLIINKNTNLSDAVFLMLKNDVQDAIVANDNQIFGLITIHDIAKIFNMAEREKLLQKKVSCFMQKDVVTVQSTTKAIDAKNIMKARKIGRLPVLEDDNLIGIIRIKDIINKLYDVISAMNDNFVNILNSIHEAICIVDKDSNVVMWDQQAEKLYGIKSADIINQSLKDFFPTALIHQVMKKREPIENVCHSPKEGTYAIISAMPLFIDDEFVGAVSTDRNITEITNLTSELEETKDKLHYLEQEVKKISDANYSFNKILGNSNIMKEKIARAQKVAVTNVNILITGQSGTGKELFARAIHQASKREGPLVAVNCSAIPENLFESEMFGYVSGAFTGASKKGKAGYFELANHGTLFLDEIGDMPMFMQSKLLRVLQENKIKRVGAEKDIEVDVRIISATNRALETMIENEKFREDLFYRINVIKIELPGLRERKEDIPILVRHFIHQFCQQNQLKIPKLEPEVLTLLMGYKWKGNIRELQNTVENLVVFSQEGEIRADSLPQKIIENQLNDKIMELEFLKDRKSINYQDELDLDLNEIISEIEIKTIKKALAITKGNKKQAARLLKIPRSTLYYKIKYYDLTELM
ncbi:sigma-54-dependent Fis family transcriptional regulator [Halanaerobium salsuginis]|uniref:PAS domain S-box-containing protein n=1 Tax=Halanaerobium salsuginis TaxID=29563 RepID=A0A1I4FMX3_9FIRM|nr:sigma-54-dependent Fis family transcriptional regulator [Halanaerobium salsuginis]SFL19215.1 PAS domain S-box-containing protein [Halanaerobium salsuginis]